MFKSSRKHSISRFITIEFRAVVKKIPNHLKLPVSQEKTIFFFSPRNSVFNAVSNRTRKTFEKPTVRRHPRRPGGTAAESHDVSGRPLPQTAGAYASRRQ